MVPLLAVIFHVLTTFPEFVLTVFEHGVLRRAVESGIVRHNIVNLRDYTDDRHKTTDDMPYGGGPGMVMLAEPVFRAVEQLRAEHGPVPLIYLSPSGERFDHRIALELAGRRKQLRRLERVGQVSVPVQAEQAEMQTDGVGADLASARRDTWAHKVPPYAEPQTEPSVPPERQAQSPVPPKLTWRDGFILLCGRYEGVDQRVLDHLVNRELSIGDYVLSGGELAAMVVIDAVARLVPGVLGNEESAGSESFATGLLDWPHYTRPEEFRGWRVPEVLLSGHHGKISGFREEAALLLTYRRRPDLLSAAQLELAKHILAKSRQEGHDDAGAD